MQSTSKNASLTNHESSLDESPIEDSQTGSSNLEWTNLSRSEQFQLLEGTFKAVPVGLTLYDSLGQLVLCNNAAAVAFNAQVSKLADQAAAERPWAIAGTPCTLEPLTPKNAGETATDGAVGPRVFLTEHTPLQLLNQTLLLATSIDITERKKLEAELTQRAYFDDLTGLANRALLQNKISEILQMHSGEERFALAFIDIDNFKHINDCYSHAVGDALLVEIGHRISSNIRSTDILARISGDEFVLVIHPLEPGIELRPFLHNILHQVKRPFYFEGSEIFTSASIGVSVYPDHGNTYETVRRNADSAMYLAKHGSKGTVTFYDRDASQSVTTRMELEQRLRLAIKDRLFCCAFQPKVDIRSGAVTGVEALIRWRDTQDHFSSPGEFVGLAIELGLIDSIAQLVLSDCVDVIHRIDDAFGNDTAISINIAARQASDTHFMQAFMQSLSATGQANRFILELTEDAFVATTHFQANIVPILRNAGVRISVDDFGTGYSSLAALTDIAVDEVKIDRSFITNIHRRPRSQGVLKAIESLSDALNVTIVAEGVETSEELAFLRSSTNIRYAQGYYFSKPFFIENLKLFETAIVEGRNLSASRASPATRSPPVSRVS